MKTALDASRLNAFLMEPEKLTVVTDEKHHLYTDDVKLPLDESLVLNIMAKGVQQAVFVQKDGDDVLVVDGRMRVRCAAEANKRLRKEGKEPVRVPVLVKRGDEADLFGIMVIANRFRHQSDPLQLAHDLQRYLDMGRTETEAGITFGLTPAQVKQHLALLDCSAKVKGAVSAGKIAPSAALKLAKLSNEEQGKALDSMLSDGNGKATVKKAEREVKKAKGQDDGPALPSKSEARRMLKRATAHHKAHDDPYALGARDALRWMLEGEEAGLSLLDEVEEKEGNPAQA